MILVDTAVWSRHLRYGDTRMTEALDVGDILMHPMVRGELALGQWKPRKPILDDLDLLPLAFAASEEDVLALIESVPLHGRGIGYVDANLLASARITPETLLWTLDKRLHAAALELEIAHEAGTH